MKLSSNTTTENQTQLNPFPDVTARCLNFNLYIHIVSLYKISLSHPELPLSLLSPLLYSSLCLTFFIPLFSFSLPPQMSVHQLRSDGWEEQTGWVFIERARTQTPTATRTRTYMHRVSECDLLQQGSRTFVPESKDFSLFSFFHFFSLSMTTSIWNRCP